MYTPAAAEIVTIGDELCRGEIINTNAAWLAERLTRLGFHVRWHSVTVDDAADMAAVLHAAATRARVVVCSGGLGPTDDDRTVDVACTLAGVAPVFDEAHRQRMVARFAERNFTVTPNNLRQVRVPAGAVVLPNSAGLAPGFQLVFGDAQVFFMPGVPREMKAIFEEHVVPRLSALCADAPATALRVWRVAGMGESHVAHRLRGVLDEAEAADATLHYRIAYPENLVTVVVRRPTPSEAESVLERVDIVVRRRLAGAIYGTGEDTLPKVIGQRLLARGETVASAESCTGGLVGDLLTDVPGASQYYRGGVVAYDNALKQALLGVREETLLQAGAVSGACVREMAEGARARLGATWAVAISGIAGPGGGTPDKPVGLVFFAIAGPHGTETRQLTWKAERRQVKQLAAFAALNLLHRLLTPERAELPEPLESGDRYGRNVNA